MAGVLHFGKVGILVGGGPAPGINGVIAAATIEAVKNGAEVVGIAQITGDETLIAVTKQAHAMLCKADEINYLSGPGRGVILIKLQKDDDKVLGFIASQGDRDLLTVETSRGAEQTVSTAKYDVTGRGGKGRELLQRGQFTRVVTSLPEVPVLNGGN